MCKGIGKLISDDGLAKYKIAIWGTLAGAQITLKSRVRNRAQINYSQPAKKSAIPPRNLTDLGRDDLCVGDSGKGQVFLLLRRHAILSERKIQNTS